ncbi:MAG: hypothetical protein KDF58_12655, partial [Alphaproteobacteria bacterium]|nr:hypothetical protein [Alphaproteobacteria bacterium]
RQQMIFGRHVPHDEILQNIEVVNAEAVMKCARRILSGSTLSLGAIGPLKNLVEFEKISALF